MVKKFHTVKWLLICTLDRRILWVSKCYNGSTHDFTIFKDVFANLTLEKYRIHVDAGFVGIAKFIACHYVFIPFKASKNRPLTIFQKAVNQCLASVRVAVENSIAQLKAFFILRIENRMRKKEKLADAFSLCAELACFKKSYANT
ncbi:MAG: transposase family protein [Hymenobacter sp.]